MGEQWEREIAWGDPKVVIGRVVLENGQKIRVERRNLDTLSFEPIGYYENLETKTPGKKQDEFERKVGEIDDVFKDWSAAVSEPTILCKANWTPSDNADGFMPPPDCINTGSAILTCSGKIIGRIYKRKGGRGARWGAPI